MARILVTGAAGFIGRHVVAALLERRHSVVGVLRGPTPPSLADHSRFTAIRKDLSTLTDAENWRDIVSGVDVVLNCAGVLQAGRRTMTAVHERAPQALFAAAAEAGISRILQVSAISADADTMYAQTKRAADESLMELDLDWVVVRPSLVYARGSYGGTSLLRGLAALPGAVVVPGDGGQTFRPVYMDDLVGILCELCETRTIKRYVIEPVGPEVMTLRDIVTATRRWLDLPAAPVMQIPMALVKTAAKVGDLLRWKVVNSTAVAQITHGNTGSSGSFAGLYAPAARSMDDVFAATPSSVQDRWHAHLALLAPVVTAVLALMWLVTGVVGLVAGEPLAASIAESLGRESVDPRFFAWGGSAIEITIALLVLSGLPTRWLVTVQVGVILMFTAVLTIALPHLWLDPLGPLLKNIPFLMLIAVWAAVRARR
jgi:nucleoside-diphosphate-sugar epimerase/uncharacterized membrane protein YphA (DoxX/SURF4 family)